MADVIEIRPAVESDVPEILETLKASLGETPILQRTPELWAWKHVDNPFGKSPVLVAAAGERIAGVRAMMRWELATPAGKLLRCLRPVDTATHPDFTRRGIFKKLTLAAIDLARDDGVDLVFNTPNERSGAGYLGMGWQHVGWVGALIRPRLWPTAEVPVDRPVDPEVVLPDAHPLDLHLDDRSPRGLRTPRSRDYLRWRFTQHPTARYRMVRAGAGVSIVRGNVRRGRSETVLSDLMGTASAQAVRATARQSKAHYLAGWFSQGSPERRAAIGGGMMPVPGVKALRLVALPLAELDVDVLDFASWDFATSDLELL